MVFDIIPLTHFMAATRGRKTGKEDDGCGNRLGELHTTFINFFLII